jgi:adenylosuccinate synthase
LRAGVRIDAGLVGADRGLRRLADLPDAARRYVARLEELSGVPAAIISTGSGRTDTIFRHDVLADCRMPAFQDA